MAIEPPTRRSSPNENSIAGARRELRRREAAWRRQRAEVARLIAAGEERAAAQLREQIGDLSPTANYAAPAKPTAPRRAQTKRPSTPQPAAGRSNRPAPTLSQPSPRPRRRRQAATWGVWLKSRPPWVLSAVAHTLMLVVLGLATFVSLADPPLFLNVSLEEGEWTEEIAEVSFASPLAELDAVEPAQKTQVEVIDLTAALEPMPLESAIQPASFDSMPVSLSELTSEARVSESDGAQAEGASSSESSSGSSLGGGTSQGGSSSPGRVRFFGAESQANRVVFVVDNSGSMQYGRMETTLVELERAVKRLSHSQSFYVVFFSDQAYPMFFPEPVHDLLPATRENKHRLSRWLPSVEMCLGGRLLDAVELAASLDPEVVYLLSDGDIRSPRVVERLTDPDAWEFPIHTLAMGARDENDAGKMAAIAQANGGGYKFVRAQPKSLLRARRKPIRYNRTPGPVWGTRVQGWSR